MRTHSDIVRAAGPDAVAAERGASIHTVRSWIVRDKIPDEHWAAFADRDWATLEELAEYAAAKKPSQVAA